MRWCLNIIVCSSQCLASGLCVGVGAGLVLLLVLAAATVVVVVVLLLLLRRHDRVHACLCVLVPFFFCFGD